MSGIAETGRPETDRVMELIDDVIEWHGSEDAMVWTAEPPDNEGDLEHPPFAVWVDEEQAALQEMLYGEVIYATGSDGVLRVVDQGRTPVAMHGDVLADLRTAYQRMQDWSQPERTVVAGRQMAARIQGLGIPVVQSPFVPDGQVYVINQPAITGPMFSEPMSFSFDDDAATYRFGMRFTCDRRRSMSDILRESSYWRPMCRDHARERQERWARIQRCRRLHHAYRQRSLSRRRRRA